MESTRRSRPDAAQQQPVTHRQSAPVFFDSSLEWRRVFAETWGPFLPVLVAAGGGVVAAMSGGRVTLGMMVVAPGLMFIAIIYFMDAVSGAHLNPAVTLAFAVRRDFAWQRVRRSSRDQFHHREHRSWYGGGPDDNLVRIHRG